MRRATRTTLPILAALALAAAGCGTSEIAADEVPGSPPALVVPTDSELGASGSNANGSADTSADSTAAADSGTADSGTAESTTPAEPAAPSGGTAAPDTAAPEPTTDPAQPPAGSPPETFESFCEQNAGAC
jgi:polysaccharide biosynthesis protein PslG